MHVHSDQYVGLGRCFFVECAHTSNYLMSSKNAEIWWKNREKKYSPIVTFSVTVSG